MSLVRAGRRRGRLTVAAFVVGGLLVGACGNDHGGSSGARAAVEVERTKTVVVIGTQATIGDGLRDRLQDSWPYVFHREAFPRATVLVNAALPDASAADALRGQVPLVEELRPSVVAIWLGLIEAREQQPLETFASNLTEVVRRTRATGARVLLADLPSVTAPDVTGYNDAIARIADAEDATLVPLHEIDIGTLSRRASSLLPNRSGQRAIAHAFERALG